MNPYPHMVPLDNRPLPALSAPEAARAKAIAKGVTGRIPGLRAFYNLNTGGIFFCYGPVPDFGVTEFPFKPEPGEDAPPTGPSTIDGIVQHINRGKMSRVQKDRIIAQNLKTEADERRDARLSRFQSIRPSAHDYAAFLDRKRRGTQKVASLPGFVARSSGLVVPA